MKFKYSTTHPSQGLTDSLPRVELQLAANGQFTRVLGLVDSGATINVLPLSAGLALNFRWDDSRATIGLSGIFGQTNFFAEFDVHFYRARYEFEIMPHAR